MLIRPTTKRTAVPHPKEGLRRIAAISGLIVGNGQIGK